MVLILFSSFSNNLSHNILDFISFKDKSSDFFRSAHLDLLAHCVKRNEIFPLMIGHQCDDIIISDRREFCLLFQYESFYTICEVHIVITPIYLCDIGTEGLPFLIRYQMRKVYLKSYLIIEDPFFQSKGSKRIRKSLTFLVLKLQFFWLSTHFLCKGKEVWSMICC